MGEAKGAKTCPFCGSDRIAVVCDDSGADTVWWAECASCLARGPGCYSETHAPVPWNRRPDAEAAEARLLAEVAALTTRAEAAEKRAESAEARAAAGGAARMEVAHAIERTRVATLQSAIEAIEARAVNRGAQVDVAQTHGGAWEVVAGKESELLAVADLLRARLRTGPMADAEVV